MISATAVNHRDSSKTEAYGEAAASSSHSGYSSAVRNRASMRLGSGIVCNGHMQAGRVFLCEGCDPDLLGAFKDQFENFPQIEHDDALDCAGYSCDPAVNEQYVPAFDSDKGRPARPWLKPKVEPEPLRYTRYCAR